MQLMLCNALVQTHKFYPFITVISILRQIYAIPVNVSVFRNMFRLKTFDFFFVCFIVCLFVFLFLFLFSGAVCYELVYIT